MITFAEVEKMGRVHTVEPVVLSVYLNVPRSPADLPGLPGRVDELVATAARNAGLSGRLREEDRRSARDEAVLAGPDWLGHPVAIFACAEVGLLEVIGLPQARSGAWPERTVLGIRPHIRPLLAALQPSPRLATEILAERPGRPARAPSACRPAWPRSTPARWKPWRFRTTGWYRATNAGAAVRWAWPPTAAPTGGPRHCPCPTSSRRWSAGHSKTGAGSSWFMREAAGLPARPWGPSA